MTPAVMEAIGDAIFDAIRAQVKLHNLTNDDFPELVGLMRLAAASLERGSVGRDEDEELEIALQSVLMEAKKTTREVNLEASTEVIRMLMHQAQIHDLTHADKRWVMQLAARSVERATMELEQAEEAMQGNA